MSDIRDRDTIDAELRLLAAVRWSIRERAAEARRLRFRKAPLSYTTELPRPTD